MFVSPELKDQKKWLHQNLKKLDQYRIQAGSGYVARTSSNTTCTTTIIQRPWNCLITEYKVIFLLQAATYEKLMSTSSDSGSHQRHMSQTQQEKSPPMSTTLSFLSRSQPSPVCVHTIQSPRTVPSLFSVLNQDTSPLNAEGAPDVWNSWARLSVGRTQDIWYSWAIPKD